MSLWPSSPEWTPIDNINGGAQYTPVDGITADDFNKIIHNLIYLHQRSSSNITSVQTSIVPSYDSFGPILTYNVSVPVPDNSGIILISPLNKDIAVQCSKYLQKVEYANGNVKFTFNAFPDANFLTFIFVIIPTADGTVLPIFDACWGDTPNDKPVRIDLSRMDPDAESRGQIVETYVDGSTKTTSLEYDKDGNIVKITDSDGHVTDLVWNKSYYTVTYNAPNCTIDPMPTSIEQGGSIESWIYANDGYTFDTMQVTMGGVDITDTALATQGDESQFRIANVTGDVVVTITTIGG